MNIQVTIPQLFYDLIARVLPGFYFLKVWEVIFNKELFSFESSNNWAQITFTGVAYIAISYVIGWILASPAYLFELKRNSSKSKKDKTFKDPYYWKQPVKWRTYIKHDWVRLIHEPSGFRLVKLKAEKRMIKSLLTATILIFTIMITLFSLSNFFNYDITLKIDFFFIKALVLSCIAIAFTIINIKMKKTYTQSLDTHFWLLQNNTFEKCFNDKQKKS